MVSIPSLLRCAQGGWLGLCSVGLPGGHQISRTSAYRLLTAQHHKQSVRKLSAELWDPIWSNAITIWHNWIQVLPYQLAKAYTKVFSLQGSRCEHRLEGMTCVWNAKEFVPHDAQMQPLPSDHGGQHHLEKDMALAVTIFSNLAATLLHLGWSSPHRKLWISHQWKGWREAQEWTYSIRWPLSRCEGCTRAAAICLFFFVQAIRLVCCTISLFRIYV